MAPRTGARKVTMGKGEGERKKGSAEREERD